MMSTSPSPITLRKRLIQLWLRLTEPRADQSDEGRRRARALASVMLILVGSGVFASLLLAFIAEEDQLQYAVGGVAFVLTFLIPYFLARTLKNVTLSLILAVIQFNLAYILIGYFSLSSEAVLGPYEDLPLNLVVYFLVPVIVAGLYLSVQVTLIMIVVQGLLMAALNPLFYQMSWGNYFVAAEGSLILSLMLLTLGASFYRSYYERQSRQALSESERRHRDLQETLFEGILTVSDGKIVTTNTGMRALSGFTEGRLRSRPLSALLPSIDVQVAAMTFEGTLQRADGSLVPVEVVARDTLYEGKPATIYALRDISERKLAEQMLQEANLRLEENVRLRTAELEDVLGREQQALRVTETLLEANKALTQSLDLQQVLQALLVHLGEIIPFECANVMLLDDQGRTLHLAAIQGYEKWYDPAEVQQVRMAVDEFPLIHNLLSLDRSVHVPDTAEDPQWTVTDFSGHIKSWLGTPLRSAGRQIGVYSLDSTQAHIFTAEHIHFAEALGAQAAVAIENARLFAAMNEQGNRLRRMAARELHTIEEERARISRELHDESGQALTALRFSLASVRDLIPIDGRPARDPAEVMAELDKTFALTHRTMDNIRTIAHRLRPAALDDLGLDAALESYCQEFEAHGPEKVHYRGVAGLTVPEAIGISFYRLLQEALTNVSKHAEAENVYVTLTAESGLLELCIEDDGDGFGDDQELLGGLGLAGMRERLAPFNGRVEIHSIPEQSTTVRAIVRIDSEQWPQTH